MQQAAIRSADGITVVDAGFFVWSEAAGSHFL